MIIRTVEMAKFMSHTDTTINLPDTGVVVITGDNGSGKSSIVEACAHALYGKSVRGSWGWRDVPAKAAQSWKSTARVVTDAVDVSRSRRKASPSLSYHRFDESTGKWILHTGDNTTKKQTALEKVIGSYDLWMRSHVFSSGDAVHFTLATDAKRKRLLEAMLGIDYFDRALVNTRQLLAKAVGDVTVCQGDQVLLDARQVVAAAGVRTAESILAQPMAVITIPDHPGDLVLPSEPVYPSPEPIEDIADPAPLEPAPTMAEPIELALLREQDKTATEDLDKASTDLRAARDDLRISHREFTEQRASLVRAQEELAKWPDGTCLTCTQDVPADMLEDLTAQSKQHEQAALGGAHLAQQDITHAEHLIEEIAVDVRAHSSKLEDIRTKVAGIKATHDEKVNARAGLEARHRDEVARVALRRRQADATQKRAHDARVNDLRRAYAAASECARKEHAVLLAHHQNAVADAAKVSQDHATGTADYSAKLAEFQAELIVIATLANHTSAKSATLNSRVKELQALETVFGLKGVRANILGKALSGLEAIANTWLERIGKTGQRIRLNEYTEKQKGGHTPALSLDLSINQDWDNEAGDVRWQPYKASSQGERRRVDVAFILALAEVSRAAQGLARGTLFFDEVFDSLDKSGVEKVTDVIHELGADRCVVVISHNDDLVARLNPVMHVHMSAGKAE